MADLEACYPPALPHELNRVLPAHESIGKHWPRLETRTGAGPKHKCRLAGLDPVSRVELCALVCTRVRSERRTAEYRCAGSAPLEPVGAPAGNQPANVIGAVVRAELQLERLSHESRAPLIDRFDARSARAIRVQHSVAHRQLRDLPRRRLEPDTGPPQRFPGVIDYGW